MKSTLVPNQMCTRKEQFENEREAEGEIEYMFYNHCDTTRLNAYKCLLCGKWHIGNKSNERR